MITAQGILNKYWGYNSFRKAQEEIINEVINNKNIIALLPTGGGKSICFQIPALLKDGVCVVVSPLIALMEDQINSLQDKGIKAIALTSKYSIEESIQAFDNLRFGNYKFLYLSPEKLQSEFIQEKISQLSVNLIAIDEAHCISQWGHDFRPAYLKISVLKKIHPDINIIALSASATPRVLEDIKNQLDLENVQVFKQSFYRDNLAIKLIRSDNVLEQLNQILLNINEPVIVYTNTRKNCIDVSNYLNHNKFKSTYYHGGLTIENKTKALNNWKEEITPLMVATNAFGMGIDKSNVRAIIHLNVPNSIENYMQEIGRAGRDGKASFAFLIYNNGTIFESESYLKKGIANTKFSKEVYIRLHEYYQIGFGEFQEKYFPFNLQDFCSKYNLPISKTFSSLNNFGNESIVELQQNANKRSKIKIVVENKYLFDYEKRNPGLNVLIKVLLRNYGGTFEQFIPVYESIIAKKMNTTKSNVIELLQKLNDDNIICYNKASQSGEIRFLKPRDDNFIINSISKNLEFRNKNKIKKAKSVVDYINNNKTCRNIQLLQYFGEANVFKCKTCDVCLTELVKTLKVDYKLIADEIISLFKNESKLTFENIFNKLDFEKENIIKTLQLLMEKNAIIVNLQNKFEMKKND
jgi:ATP-dependent DNA helicase RecQ